MKLSKTNLIFGTPKRSPVRVPVFMNLELRTTSVQHLCAELPYDWHVPMRMKMSSGCSVLTWLHEETFGQASTLRGYNMVVEAVAVGVTYGRFGQCSVPERVQK